MVVESWIEDNVEYRIMKDGTIWTRYGLDDEWDEWIISNSQTLFVRRIMFHVGFPMCEYKEQFD